MKILKKHIVSSLGTKKHFSDYVFDSFEAYKTRSSVKKAIKRGNIRLNGAIVSSAVYVKDGDCIEQYESQQIQPKVYQLKLEVLYEDDNLAVIHKPPGLVVSGNQFKTVQNAVLYNLKPSQVEDKLEWPKPVHRIDSGTSGLLLIAKTKLAQLDLSKQFENKTIRKRYRAVVSGKVQNEGFVDSDIETKASYSEYKLIKSVRSLTNDYVSLVDLFPHTGRTHQLRIHMSSISHPIMGDKLYGENHLMIKGKGLFLSAVELSFMHPVTHKTISIKIDQPKKFDTFLEREQIRWEKYNLD